MPLFEIIFASWYLQTYNTTIKFLNLYWFCLKISHLRTFCTNCPELRGKKPIFFHKSSLFLLCCESDEYIKKRLAKMFLLDTFFSSTEYLGLKLSPDNPTNGPIRNGTLHKYLTSCNENNYYTTDLNKYILIVSKLLCLQ